MCVRPKCEDDLPWQHKGAEHVGGGRARLSRTLTRRARLGAERKAAGHDLPVAGKLQQSSIHALISVACPAGASGLQPTPCERSCLSALRSALGSPAADAHTSPISMSATGASAPPVDNGGGAFAAAAAAAERETSTSDKPDSLNPPAPPGGCCCTAAACLAAPRRLAAAAAGGVRRFWRDLTWAEISGSLGDLGTFIPLLIGLVTTCGLNLSTTLIFSGAWAGAEDGAPPGSPAARRRAALPPAACRSPLSCLPAPAGPHTCCRRVQRPHWRHVWHPHAGAANEDDCSGGAVAGRPDRSAGLLAWEGWRRAALPAPNALPLLNTPMTSVPPRLRQIMAAGIFVSACVLVMGALRAFWLAGRCARQAGCTA